MEKRSSNRIFGGKFAAAAVAILGLCLIGMLAVGGTVSAQAAKFDSSMDCSITVNMPSKSDSQYKNMPSVPDGLVYDLYKVASAKQTSGHDAYSFEVEATSAFAGLADSFTQLGQINSTQAGASASYTEKYNEITQLAINMVKDSNIEPERSTVVDYQSLELRSGLYLVLIHGNDPKDSKDYIVDAGNGSLATIAKSSTNEFLFTPQLVGVPGRYDEKTNTNNTANRVEWNYNVEVTAKPEWHPLYGDLEIVKTLRSYDDGKPVTFVFEIEGANGAGEVTYSNTASIVFEAASTKAARIGHIPAGLKITVKEVYSGTSYQLVSSATQTATIVAEDVVSVNFENDYNGGGNSGGSVTNTFSYETGEGQDAARSAGQWVWSKDGEEQE